MGITGDNRKVSSMRLAAILLALACATVRADDFVRETVDEIIVLRVDDSQHDKLVFLRDGKIVATRLKTDDMLWAISGEHFQLIWTDYYTAVRCVESRHLTHWAMKEDPTEIGQNGTWHDMRRRMVDLRAPE